MKIIQTPVRFYPFVGGVENYVYCISRGLVKLGCEVKVICADEPGLKDGEISGISVKRLNYIGKIANTNITLKLPYVLLKEDFDIIHTHIPTPWSADWSAIVSFIKRKPLVVTYHNDLGSEGIAGLLTKIYNKTFLKFVLKQSSLIIITQENYLKTSPYLKDYSYKINVVSPGVDTEKFKPIKIKKIRNSVFFLSVLDEFHRYKGLDYLLKAIKIARKNIPDVKLVVGGNGKLLEEYKERVKSLGIEDNVDFIGYIPENKLVSYYNKCDVFVLPSVSSDQEGFGLVLLEALACGVPVITTKIVGVAKEIKKYNLGEVIKTRDETVLGRAIVRSLENKNLFDNGRNFIEKEYTWERAVKKMLAVYRGFDGFN